MRIIAGKWKAKRLMTPKTEKIRPTLDRIKEGLFSILMPYIKNADVLDLFAGTGNLGLEALSRGSRFVWFNDINKEARNIISQNVRLTEYENCVKITGKEYEKCLKQIYVENAKFDIIFIDPPYDTKYEEKALNLITEYKLLRPDGIVVLEGDKRKEFNENVDNLILKDKKIYGRVVIRLYKWKE